MKKVIPLLKISFFALLSILIFSFSTDKKENDSKLVGIWKGFEKDGQIEGVEKHWIQQRFADGTYVIMFTAKQDCEIQTFTEKGKWWTENGKFYELSSSTKDIDVYSYEVKGEESVEFKSIKLTGKDDNTYVFSDYRLDLK
ncbi:hypothetical protein SGQ83_11950 [Flavobacterium sp. Fl-318]|uniref:Lipocalin-like domain-containing protein n=1 Tax=Flavobacterium cupriresistens TaxID=2893885 RepID=A0ABU4RDY1_9FLAO|nr:MULTISPECIES: hypothetical protein [unclassified Flavobacterium]MDX6190063.1 hypothetical protein [Flavobacterium sp. Fl-318]UFH42887.1 hypothetical protein LNP23_01400 [Flavobacterium sp. F-323]